MEYRLNILKEHNLGIREIQETISKIDPIPGAREFLDGAASHRSSSSAIPSNSSHSR